MNVFLEFYKIAQGLQREKVKYALIGGVAMAEPESSFSTKRNKPALDSGKKMN